MSYYGSYVGDKFGGGIGRRVGLDESRKKKLKGGVARVAVFTETHERLRDCRGEVGRWGSTCDSQSKPGQVEESKGQSQPEMVAAGHLLNSLHGSG